MTFDATVTLGNILTAVTIVVGLFAAVSRAYRLLDRRSIVFETTIGTHARLLDAHAARMEKQDDLLLRISGDMQRVVGRLEMINPQTVIEAAAAALGVIKAAEAVALQTVAAAAAAAAAALPHSSNSPS